MTQFDYGLSNAIFILTAIDPDLGNIFQRVFVVFNRNMKAIQDNRTTQEKVLIMIEKYPFPGEQFKIPVGMPSHQRKRLKQMKLS